MPLSPSPSPLRLPRSIAWLFERRWGNLATFAVCTGMLAFGYFLQFVKGIEPCPLCMIQRLAFAITGVVSLVAALHHPARIGARLYGAIIALAALGGAAVAARHVWLQHIPAEQRPSCGPGLDYLLSTFGPLESFSRILRGSGECGVVDWTFLGLSIPELTLPSFIAFAAWAVFLALRK
jgi:disulfide bond formation protein DsbB